MKGLGTAKKPRPELVREALLLSTMQGLSEGQIARIQDSSDQAVELRIYRARKMRREKLADHWDTP